MTTDELRDRLAEARSQAHRPYAESLVAVYAKYERGELTFESVLRCAELLGKRARRDEARALACVEAERGAKQQ